MDNILSKWRRRVVRKTMVFAGREWDADDPFLKDFAPKGRPHVSSNSLEEGCYRVFNCPQCGNKMFSIINEKCKCGCGLQMFVDYDGKVETVDGDLDYQTAPDSIREFLLPCEIKNRKDLKENDFHEIECCFAKGKVHIPWGNSNTDDQMSVRQALAKRNERRRAEIASDQSDNEGCLMWFGGFLCLSIVFYSKIKNLWFFAAIVIAGIFLLRNTFKTHRNLVESWQEDDRRLEELLRDLYMHEADRLRDNMLAKGRWLERKKREEEDRRQREIAKQKEKELIRKMRETEVGIVKGICLGKIPFSEFLREIVSGDGHGYEKRVKKFIELCGFTCELVSRGADQGVDLILREGDFSAAIQCKYYAEANAGNDAVQQVFTGARFYSCGQSVVLTNNGFTKSAIDAAEKVGVMLVQQDRIVEFLDQIPGGRKKIDQLTDRDIVVPESIDSAAAEMYRGVMRAIRDA